MRGPGSESNALMGLIWQARVVDSRGQGHKIFNISFDTDSTHIWIKYKYSSCNLMSDTDRMIVKAE